MWGCNNTVQPDADILATFPETLELTVCDTVIADLIEPSDIILVDSHFVIREPQGNPMNSVYDISGRCVRQFLQRGRGPGETNNLMGTSVVRYDMPA